MEFINDNENEINDNDINENIRLPDQIIRDRLLDYDDDFFIDDNLERAIAESLREFRLQHNNYDHGELDERKIEEIDQSFEEEKKEIINIPILPIFKTKIMRLIHFDKQLKELWEKVSPIISLYESGQILYHIVDEDTYNTMFQSLKSIRIPSEEQSLLETIFIKQLI